VTRDHAPRLNAPLADQTTCSALYRLNFPIIIRTLAQSFINPLPPSDAVRKQKKIYLLSSVFKKKIIIKLKNITPLELKFKYLGISHSLKLRISM